MTMSVSENPVENGAASVHSDREEGEIVDDDLSDISSEEEYLLRQRLCVLENYNTALKKRKKAKSQSISGDKEINYTSFGDLTLSDISESEIDIKTSPNKVEILPRNLIPNLEKNKKHIKKSESEHKSKREKKKKRKHIKKNKQNTDINILSISSSEDESFDEYRNKRRKLHNAVKINEQVDQKSLKDRLLSMFSNDLKPETEQLINLVDVVDGQAPEDKAFTISSNHDLGHAINSVSNTDSKINNDRNFHTESEAKSKTLLQNEDKTKQSDDSDLDLEALRQSALSTKKSKDLRSCIKNNNALKQNSEEDSDTQELRLICLKSSLLKKAFEIKQKQKMKKKLNKARNDSLIDDILLANENEGSTDIESVDMEVSDNQDSLENAPNIFEGKDACTDCCKEHRQDNDIDEDEDLLRAKLLISLSNSLPKFKTSPEKKPSKTDEKKIIINLGDSDSCSDSEATKNLTKMHMKLEQLTFQERLDLLLKGARAETEKKQKENESPPATFVPKAVNHLPLSDQKEYQMLVKRMGELEKIKRQRQVILSQVKKDQVANSNILSSAQLNISKTIEDKIAESRKLIAEDSAKVLKLKEEGKHLSQRFKIVMSELKNLKTALASNKKELMVAQKSLVQKRNYHNNLVAKFQTVPVAASEKKRLVINTKSEPQLIETLSITVKNNTNNTADCKIVKTMNVTEEKKIVLSTSEMHDKASIEDYISPLIPKDKPRIVHDPNVILCKFEFTSTGCQDGNCKFLHLNT